MKNALIISFLLISTGLFTQSKNLLPAKKPQTKITAAPTLCQCLTAPGGNPSQDKPKGCKEVIRKRYGTVKPTLNQMRADYYRCKGK
jgi:hypothetical protein